MDINKNLRGHDFGCECPVCMADHIGFKRMVEKRLDRAKEALEMLDPTLPGKVCLPPAVRFKRYSHEHAMSIDCIGSDDDYTSELRHMYIEKAGFVILTDEMICGLTDVLVYLTKGIKNPKVVELGAGKGWLTHWLNTIGKEDKRGDWVNVQATDNGAWDNDKMRSPQCLQPWVKKQDAVEYVELYKPDVVIMSWPYFGDKWATQVAMALKPGTHIIYIGESDYGCCAEDSFFRATDRISGRSWEDGYVPSKLETLESRANKGFVSWAGIHDYINIRTVSDLTPVEKQEILGDQEKADKDYRDRMAKYAKDDEEEE